jgi:UDP-N-acetyl-2-amino-2-deoxyglucuronate dehydrogenase
MPTPSRTSFALTGVAGFVAPRHLEAIKDVGGKLVAALDPSDSVGILDRYDRSTEFFTSPERFERFLSSHGADWLSVCSPNHLHDVHARLGMNNGANVLCEKPLCLSPWNLDALAETEIKTGKRVFTVLQLRYVPALKKLKNDDFFSASTTKRLKVNLKYVTPRGAWYHQSWKGDIDKSGGLITNIGIHMLDMLLWLYGPCDKMSVTYRAPTRVSGTLQLARADVNWLLSIDAADGAGGGTGIRSLTVDGKEVEFSDGFTGLHKIVYEETLAGRGHGIDVARPAIELAHRLRHLPIKG